MYTLQLHKQAGIYLKAAELGIETKHCIFNFNSYICQFEQLSMSKYFNTDHLMVKENLVFYHKLRYWHTCQHLKLKMQFTISMKLSNDYWSKTKFPKGSEGEKKTFLPTEVQLAGMHHVSSIYNIQRLHVLCISSMLYETAFYKVMFWLSSTCTIKCLTEYN